MSERPETTTDRRDSPRVPMRFRVRNVMEGGDFREYDGDLSLGGISFQGDPAKAGGRYEIRFKLPNGERELEAQGEPIQRVDAKGKGVQLRFVELDTPTELAIAKYLDDLTGTAR